MKIDMSKYNRKLNAYNLFLGGFHFTPSGRLLADREQTAIIASLYAHYSDRSDIAERMGNIILLLTAVFVIKSFKFLFLM